MAVCVADPTAGLGEAIDAVAAADEALADALRRVADGDLDSAADLAEALREADRARVRLDGLRMLVAVARECTAGGRLTATERLQLQESLKRAGRW